ncbi:hypothetical protein FJZ28_01015 [Candidatus Peregrinibacteria bacterium]|nr:hypothetical protein [Candidatus Peregrinibacteria bacterium]
MLLQLGVAILVFCYEALVLLGAAMITGRLIGVCMGESVPENRRLLLGFALYPALVTWGGFLLLWRIPFLTQAAGLLCAAYAVSGLWNGARRATWTGKYPFLKTHC